MNLTIPDPVFNRADLFGVVDIGGKLYEIATVRGPVSVRLVALTAREARQRRLGGWLARRGIHF